MKVLEEMIRGLSSYDGGPMGIMEVCGTHTSTAFRGGIRGLLPREIQLISGPGCPVCLASSAYIDRLCCLAGQEGHIVVSFGDLLRVKGTQGSLLDARARGGRVEMVYSPLDALTIAAREPEQTVVMAAVGFETTAPVYSLLAETALERGITNLRLLTALKCLLPALEALCPQAGVDAFIAPGHVATILGSDAFVPLAKRFGKPFAVAGFTPENMLAAIALLVSRVRDGRAGVDNLYGEVVRPEGNRRALVSIDRYFIPGDAFWRGLYTLENSGLYLRDEYMALDAGSRGLYDEPGSEQGCCCAQVLTGRIDPPQCPLFGRECTPDDARGPCMVSAEGACGIWYHGG